MIILMIVVQVDVGIGIIYCYFDSKELFVNVLYQESVQCFMKKVKIDFLKIFVREGFYYFFYCLIDFIKESEYVLFFFEMNKDVYFLNEMSCKFFDELIQMFDVFFQCGKFEGVFCSLLFNVLMVILFGVYFKFYQFVWVGSVEIMKLFLKELE